MYAFIYLFHFLAICLPPSLHIKDKSSVAAAIEFAVLGLKVKDIIVCGHSNCGAMQALYQDEKDFEGMPHLKEWIELIQTH